MTDMMHHLSDLRQSANYVKYLESQGWIVERIDNINYFFKKIPLGTVLKVQRPGKIDFETIQKLEKKYKVFQTVIEPNLTSVVNSFSDIHNLLSSNGYKLSKDIYLPSKTIHLDITRPLKFKKETRRAIRKGSQFKIKEYSTPKEIEIFYKAWKKSVTFMRYVPNLESLVNLKKSFPNNTSIFLASHNKIGNIIGGVIFTRSSHDIDSKADGIGYY